MDKRAVDAARTEYGRAVESAAAVATAIDFQVLEKNWTAFLVAAGRVFTKLEQGAKVAPKSKAWWGKQVHQRRTDPLLAYLWHARNADEHTLQQVTELHPGNATMVDPTKEDVAALKYAMEKETRPWVPLELVEWVPQHVMLLPVKDRGVLYQPPSAHLGTQITSTSPARTAELALAFLDTMVEEADELSREHVNEGGML